MKVNQLLVIQLIYGEVCVLYRFTMWLCTSISLMFQKEGLCDTNRTAPYISHILSPMYVIFWLFLKSVYDQYQLQEDAPTPIIILQENTPHTNYYLQEDDPTPIITHRKMPPHQLLLIGRCPLHQLSLTGICSYTNYHIQEDAPYTNNHLQKDACTPIITYRKMPTPMISYRKMLVHQLSLTGRCLHQWFLIERNSLFQWSLAQYCRKNPTSHIHQ